MTNVECYNTLFTHESYDYTLHNDRKLSNGEHRTSEHNITYIIVDIR